MDRDIWLTSSTKTVDSVLATQSHVDDVLRAAANAPRLSRRARARAERRERKLHAEMVVGQATVETSTGDRTHA